MESAKKEYLGCCKAGTESQRKAVEELANEKTNCRKILAKARGGYVEGADPPFPKEEDIKDAPRTIVYTDGGLKSPDRKWWSLGGF